MGAKIMEKWYITNVHTCIYMHAQAGNNDNPFPIFYTTGLRMLLL